MNSLMIWNREGATDSEILAWQLLQKSEATHDVIILEVENTGQLKKEHERLINEGWMFQGIGSGAFTRAYSYMRSDI